MSRLAALLRAAAPLLDLLDGIPWVAEAESLRLLVVGEAAARLLGDPPDTWLAGPRLVWLDRVAPADRASVVAARRRAAAGAAGSIEYRARTAGGAAVRVVELLRPAVDEAGRTVLLGLSFVQRQGAGAADVHAVANALTTVACLEAAPPPAEPGPARRRILLVDDDAELRRLAVRILDRAGYEAHAVDAVEPALAALERLGRVDLLVTDLALRAERTAGAELVARARGAQPALRVLIASGLGEAASLLPPGAAFLAKPFTPGMLVRAIAAALDG